MERRDLAAAVAFGLLTLPFHPHWLDFEMARRGLAMLLGSAILLTLSRASSTPRPRGLGWLAASCLIAVGLLVQAGNLWQGVFYTSYLIAVCAAFVFGATRPPDALLKIAAPTLCVVVGYGLLQAFGVEWPSGYARTEAVSTLGNRNVASELVTVGTAGLCAWWVRTADPERIGQTKTATATVLALLLVASTAYLGANGSRSGIFATALIALVSAASCLRHSKARAALLVGSLAIMAIAQIAAAPAPEDVDPRPEAVSTNAAIAAEPPSTLAVRWEIWKSGVDMVLDAPLAGHGTGQFRFAYPAYRSDAEIELSSFGRQFPTFVATAHNDYLEILIERGVLGLVLWVGFWIVLLASALRRSGRSALPWMLPGIAFCLLGMVRSPLTNAPAAMLALALVGSAVGTLPAARQSAAEGSGRFRLPRLAAWLLAALLAASATSILVSQLAFAAAVQPVAGRDQATLDRPALDTAIAWHGSEPRFRSARIRAIRAEATSPQAAFASSREDAEALRHLDPDNPTSRYLLAELAHFAGENAEAENELNHLLAVDPRHIEGVLLRASRYALARQTDLAIQSLYFDPSPRLRGALASQLQLLADGFRGRDDGGAARQFAAEARFIRALDALQSGTSPDGRDLKPRTDLETVRSDRIRALYARDFSLRGEQSLADELAPDGALAMSASIQRLMAGLLDDLAESSPRWRRAIEATPTR